MLLEITSVIFALLSIYYLIKESKLGWYFGIINIITYGIIFYNKEIYTNCILQTFFLIQSIYAIIKWSKKENIEVKRLDVPTFITNHIPFLSLLICLSYMAVELLFGGKPTIIQSTIFSLSIYATILLMNKVLETWIFWILNNILLIILLYDEHLYLSVGLYIIYIAMDIKGFIDWKRIYKSQNLR